VTVVERVERKYALIRVGRGDYLLPSNDAQTLWRIHTYTEDGLAEYQDARGRWHKVTGEFWAIERFNLSIAGGIPEHVDVLDWEHWDHWEGNFRTRADAIAAALGRSPQ
jgi:hypothetical protein